MQENGWVKKTRPVRPQVPMNRRAILTLVLLSVLLILSAWLAVPVFLRTVAAPSGYRAADSGRAGLVLLLTGDQTAAPGYGLLRDVLAAAGYDSYLHPLSLDGSRNQSAVHTGNVDQAALAEAIATAVRLSGFPADRVWVVADPQSAASVFVAMDPASAGGLILIAPQSWPAAATTLQSAWTDSPKNLIILTAQKPDQAAESFFESLTGEDATLFAGNQQAQGWGDSTFQSVDGRVSLVLFASLIEELALISPRLLAELSARLHEQLSEPAAALTVGAAAAGQAATALYRLLLALTLLLALPFAGGLMSGRNDLPASPSEQPGGRIAQLLFWFAACLVATTAAWLLRRLFPAGYSWTAWFVLLAPGICGWIAALWHVFVVRPEQKQATPEARLRFAPAGLPAAILLPVLLTLTLLPLPVFWLSGRPLIWILLMAVNMAVGSNAAAGSFLISKGPWFLLPPLLLLVSGPAAALIAALIVAAALWSERCGRLFAGICRSRWLARLIQAACHTLLIYPLARLL